MMCDELKNKLDKWFDDHKEEMIKDLSDLVAIRGVAGDAEGEAPFGKGALDALLKADEIEKRLGFATKLYDNACLSADMNGKETALAMLCHVDVVPEGDGWDTDPFTVVEKGGALYGRGTSDDKGPAIAASYAMRAAKDLCPELTKNCRLILGSSEENGAADLVHYTKYDKYPDKVFSPDSDFPLINIEKGRFAPDFSKDWIESKTLPRITSIVGGHVRNIVPRVTTAEVEGLNASDCRAICDDVTKTFGGVIELADTDKGVKFTCIGAAAHASTPELGLNSTTLLITALLHLPLAECEGLYRLRALNELVPHGDVTGKSLGIACADEESGALSMNMGVFEFGLTGMCGNLDVRSPIFADEMPLEALTAAAFGKKGIAYRTSDISKSHSVPSDSPFVKTLLGIYEDFTGDKSEALAIGGITYVHDVPGGVAFGCTMPGHDACIHGANEHITLDELFTSSKIFTKAIIDLCK